MKSNSRSKTLLAMLLSLSLGLKVDQSLNLIRFHCTPSLAT
jgi:hypothetical protein